jgi:hypothetical protein
MNEASRRSADLLPDVVEAHGGLDRWNAFTTLHATVVSGGHLFVIKGVPQDPAPREQTAASRLAGLGRWIGCQGTRRRNRLSPAALGDCLRDVAGGLGGR